MKNQIISNDGKMDIYIQACDEKWANIKVAYHNLLERRKYGNGQVQRKVSLPSLSFEKYEFEQTYPNQMSIHFYKRYLSDNKLAILELCARLNCAPSNTACS